jgi:hypothetical protein
MFQSTYELRVYLSVVSSATLSVNTDYIKSNEKVISDRLNGKDLEGSGRGLVF